ncbi:MAG: sugar nucleotide-binding protein [Pseudomonadota bacterium]
MTVLVFGAGGPLDPILANVPGVVVLSPQAADPRRPADCADLVDDLAPTAVLYLATCRNADLAEADPSFAQAVNAATPHALAAACASADIPFVFLSGADVFDGLLPMAYVASDPACPTTALGHSLWTGETGILDVGGRTAVVRSTWIFGSDIDQATQEAGIQTSPTLWRVPDGGDGAPTPAFDLASALLAIAAALVHHSEKAGTYHFAGDQNTTLAGFAQRLALNAGQTAPQIESCAASDLWSYPRVIPNARLDCRTTQAVFGLQRPDWRAALRPVGLKSGNRRDVA